ncbi:hypothetical protein OX283_009660 [Flavobacterium sp. SUN052]|uniref:hypothetical protein n=1 Tax=Flavobacterium sp. SUN052 TaxID=3002441 RepID=UPI00237E2480|nr:hypothetical protein [Flavobacterium sp. SUN052]MEC4004921.1 hypothetical protein [Flavobacterium sp. SUN052]
MTTFNTDNQVIHFSDKFGLITDNQVILTKLHGNNKIRIDSIDKINLIKRRVFYSNLFIFILSMCVFSFAYFFFESEKIQMYASLVIFGIVLLVYSLLHKFYLYKIVIKEKDNSIVEFQTTQLNRKSIKEFYMTILKKVPKNQVK